MLDIALVQLNTPANQADALAQAAPLVREAAAGGARLIATPEATNLLQRDRTRLFASLAPMDEDVCVLGLRRLADALGVWLLIGSAMIRHADGKAANRSLLIDPSGAIAAAYDKVHLFDVDLPSGEHHRESASVTPGDRAVVAEAGGVKLGLSVCYDLRFPALYRALARAGAEALTIPAAFTRPTGEAHWSILLRARAIENGCYVLAPAQGGTHEDGRATWGRSSVISPWGEVIAIADHDQPGIVNARIDPDEVKRVRSAIPALDHERTFAGP